MSSNPIYLFLLQLCQSITMYLLIMSFLVYVGSIAFSHLFDFHKLFEVDSVISCMKSSPLEINALVNCLTSHIHCPLELAYAS